VDRPFLLEINKFTGLIRQKIHLQVCKKVVKMELCSDHFSSQLCQPGGSQ
jgi:hypothetical protein